jgi:hypothetical protein
MQLAPEQAEQSVSVKLDILDSKAATKRRGTRPRRALWSRYLRTFAVVFVFLLAFRIALPSIARNHVSKVLDGTKGYSGRLGGLDVNLWRGAYELTDIELYREGGTFERPFISIERSDVSVRWLDLLRGQVVAEVVLHQPRIEFVSASSGPEAQTGEEASWSERIGKLVPFRIDRFAMRDAEVRFTHEGIDPPVDLFVTEAFLEILNLTNQPNPDAEKGLMAEAEAAGRPFGTGEFEARLRFDVLAPQPRFELDAVLRGIEMVELNDFLQAYGNVDAEGGKFEMFAEFAASDGRVEGYVKTLIQDLKVVRASEIEGPLDAVQTFWEGFVALGAELLENQPHNRLAVRVPLRGELGETRTNLLSIVGSLLRNAFVVALRPAIDDSIELENLEVASSRKAPEGE